MVRRLADSPGDPLRCAITPVSLCPPTTGLRVPGGVPHAHATGFSGLARASFQCCQNFGRERTSHTAKIFFPSSSASAHAGPSLVGEAMVYFRFNTFSHGLLTRQNRVVVAAVPVSVKENNPSVVRRILGRSSASGTGTQNFIAKEVFLALSEARRCTQVPLRQLDSLQSFGFGSFIGPDGACTVKSLRGELPGRYLQCRPDGGVEPRVWNKNFLRRHSGDETGQD
jgi:hypothetical protein